jgi:hypothetical protein
LEALAALRPKDEIFKVRGKTMAIKTVAPAVA